MPNFNQLQQSTQPKTNTNRRHAFGITAVLVIALVAITVTVTAMSISSNGTKIIRYEPYDPPIGNAVVFGVPVAQYTSILKNASLTELQYNATMRRWEAHKNVDIAAPLGTPVLATFAGTVTSVRDHLMYGRMVTIRHINGLESVYSNLDKNTLVRVNETVVKGQRIGSVGQTGNVEFTNIPHLKIEVLQNSKKIDPNDYIDFPIK